MLPILERPRYRNIPDDHIFSAQTPGAAITLIDERLPQHTKFGA